MPPVAPFAPPPLIWAHCHYGGESLSALLYPLIMVCHVGFIFTQLSSASFGQIYIPTHKKHYVLKHFTSGNWKIPSGKDPLNWFAQRKIFSERSSFFLSEFPKWRTIVWLCTFCFEWNRCNFGTILSYAGDRLHEVSVDCSPSFCLQHFIPHACHNCTVLRFNTVFSFLCASYVTHAWPTCEPWPCVISCHPRVTHVWPVWPL